MEGKPMAKKSLTFWATQNTGPVTDDDRLIDGGSVLNDLPANGSYDTTNGLGGPTVDFFSDGTDAIFNPSGNWNSVKLFKIAGSEKLLDGQNLILRNFVDARADFGSGKKDLNIDVEGAKRGQIDTGSGEDNVSVTVSSNGPGGSVFDNHFEVHTGSDDDTVLFGPAGPVPGFPGNDTTGVNTTIDAYLGSGNDSFDSSALISTNMIDGGSGRDTITSGDGDDIIDGGSGKDVIDAGGGNNDIFGDTGRDTITSGDGDDTIDGFSGNDLIDAGDGNNDITGGSGDDTITSGTGNDTIDGGSGNDSITVGLAGGDNSVTGGSGNDDIMGGHGNDTLIGGSGEDTLNGRGSNDLLKGEGSDDVLLAGGGADTVIGGDGADIIFTHDGPDLIVFEDVSDSGIGAGARDVVGDFAQGLDLLDFTAIGALSFIGGAAFSGAPEVRFFQTASDTIVEVDANGDLGADMQVELSGLITLLGTDFA